MIRKESVAGSFYPAYADEEQRYFEHFNKVLDEHDIKLSDIKPRAIIVPHAGHIYSGFTANIAYRLLKESEIKNFVVIGPSHYVAFKGGSVCAYEGYKTPFGLLDGDKEMSQKLADRFGFECYLQAHQEHSTEVQFPFIKYYIPDAKVVEIVYSEEEPIHLASIIEYILGFKEWGVIISTDLSHFYTLNEAKRLDSICIEAVKKLEPSLMHSGCEACGKIGVEAMLIAAKKLNLQPFMLDYRTSADVSGDESRVVGYLSVAFS